jgi:hypothetical protein
MPNKSRRDKPKTRAPGRRTARISRPADSVKALLQTRSPVLSAISEQTQRQQAWRQWLQEHVPAELLAYVTGVVERDKQLVIFTASAAWGGRLRYALAELEPALLSAHAGLERVTVRVLPAARHRE